MPTHLCHRPPKADAAANAAPACPGTPAHRLYARLRHEHGLSHTEATRHLREALRGYFRPRS